MDYVSILRKMVGERALVTYDRRRKFICLYVKNKKVLDVGCVGGDSFIVDARFLDSLRVALNIKKEPSTEVDGPLEFSLSAKNYLLEMFRLLMGYFYGAHNLDLDKLVVKYLKVAEGKFLLKNMEYSALIFLIEREAFLKALFSMPLVVDRMRAALIWLLATIQEDETLCRKTLQKAYQVLKDYTRIIYSDDNIALWRSIKWTICVYWPYASTVMGV